ncbi:MAG: integrase, partial [Alphaproteobacteria bacterium]
ENRWLLALISDTGMRLSEAAGLASDDIVLDAEIPHINPCHREYELQSHVTASKYLHLNSASEP